MRISGGIARGIPLRVTKSKSLRPATEANRERLFSSIANQIQHKKVLDLFAGTGSYGLEALSRGAKNAHFIEQNKRVFNDLRHNFEQVKKSSGLDEFAGRFTNRDVLGFLKQKEKNYDIVFLDPPYEDFAKLGEKVLNLLISNGFVHHGSVLIHEAPTQEISNFVKWKLKKVLGKEKKGAPNYRIYSPVVP